MQGDVMASVGLINICLWREGGEGRKRFMGVH